MIKRTIITYVGEKNTLEQQIKGSEAETSLDYLLTKEFAWLDENEDIEVVEDVQTQKLKHADFILHKNDKEYLIDMKGVKTYNKTDMNKHTMVEVVNDHNLKGWLYTGVPNHYSCFMFPDNSFYLIRTSRLRKDIIPNIKAKYKDDCVEDDFFKVKNSKCDYFHKFDEYKNGYLYDADEDTYTNLDYTVIKCRSKTQLCLLPKEYLDSMVDNGKCKKMKLSNEEYKMIQKLVSKHISKGTGVYVN